MVKQTEPNSKDKYILWWNKQLSRLSYVFIVLHTQFRGFVYSVDIIGFWVVNFDEKKLIHIDCGSFFWFIGKVLIISTPIAVSKTFGHNHKTSNVWHISRIEFKFTFFLFYKSDTCINKRIELNDASKWAACLHPTFDNDNYVFDCILKDHHGVLDMCISLSCFTDSTVLLNEYSFDVSNEC